MKNLSIVTLLLLPALALCLSGCFPEQASYKNTGIVIVGMQNSAKYGKCEGCAKDAQTMNSILSKYGKTTVLQDKQATKAAVLNALNEISQKDLMIFFYSGHGGSNKIGDVSEEPDHRNEYLCLYNTYLLDNEIWNVVCKAKGRVLLIFDCCHSETMFRSPGIDFSEIVEEEKMARGNSGVRMLCWSGCPDDNYSYGGANGGILTNAIRDSYKKSRTYSDVWKLTMYRASSQNPRKTQIGDGFSGKVFR